MPCEHRIFNFIFHKTNKSNFQRQIATFDTSTNSIQDPDIANRIIQLAINRTGKSIAGESGKAQILNGLDKETKTTSKPKLSKAEIEQGEQDIQSINNDLKLLSALLGRPVSTQDLPQLTNQIKGGSRGRQTTAPKPIISSTTTSTTPSTTTTTSTTTSKPAIIKEVELLQSLLNTRPDKRPDPGPDYYGKTDEAILATILKQQGIGPTNNNIPIVSC